MGELDIKPGYDVLTGLSDKTLEQLGRIMGPGRTLEAPKINATDVTSGSAAVSRVVVGSVSSVDQSRHLGDFPTQQNPINNR